MTLHIRFEYSKSVPSFVPVHWLVFAVRLLTPKNKNKILSASVIFVNENENENVEKRENNEFVNENENEKIENENENENAKIAKLVTQRKCQHTICRSIRCADVM